jgi:hypothetical protein
VTQLPRRARQQAIPNCWSTRSPPGSCIDCADRRDLREAIFLGRQRPDLNVGGVTLIQPPECVVLDHPGVVRFAAGSETGPRSHTWRVEGVSNASGHDDIYVGTRRTMKDVKISLHDAKPPKHAEPATILAFDKRYADKKQMERKMIVPMARTAPVAPGWRRELEILTPTTTFGTFAETPPLKPGEVIQWWTPPPHPSNCLSTCTSATPIPSVEDLRCNARLDRRR